MISLHILVDMCSNATILMSFIQGHFKSRLAFIRFIPNIYGKV